MKQSKLSGSAKKNRRGIQTDFYEKRHGFIQTYNYLALIHKEGSKLVHNLPVPQRE